MKNFELTTEREKVHGIGIGFLFGNHQPKKKYKTANIEFSFVFVCWIFRICISYDYQQ